MNQLKLAQLSFALFSLGVLLAACELDEEEGAKTQELDNYFRLCAESCEDGIDCVEGVCTRACEEDEQCRAISGKSVCLPTSSGALACDRECTFDHDCRAYSDEHMCDRGSCRAPQDEGGTVAGHPAAADDGILFSMVQLIQTPRPPSNLAEEILCGFPEGTLNLDGSLPCELMSTGGFSWTGELPVSLYAVSDNLRVAVVEQMRAEGKCDTAHTESCSSVKLTGLRQLEGDNLKQCQTDGAAAEYMAFDGFCFIDVNAQDAEGNYIAGGSTDGTTLLEHCPVDERRAFRFTGSAHSQGALYVVCPEGAYMNSVP